MLISKTFDHNFKNMILVNWIFIDWIREVKQTIIFSTKPDDIIKWKLSTSLEYL